MGNGNWTHPIIVKVRVNFEYAKKKKNMSAYISANMGINLIIICAAVLMPMYMYYMTITIHPGGCLGFSSPAGLLMLME